MATNIAVPVEEELYTLDSIRRAYLSTIDEVTVIPAMMGFMLLLGIIIKNAILLIHFALEQMKAGMNKTEAMLESIKI